MAHNVLLQLSGSEGVGRILLFEGLKYSVLVRPTVYGSPVLTAQGIYFLEQMECVAHVRDEQELSHSECEYILDNYLFEFAKRHLDTRMTLRISEGRFWIDDSSSMYNWADQRLTQTLALDQSNDESVLEIEALDPTDDIDLSDWDIGVNYAAPVLAEYVRNISTLLEKKVDVKVVPSEEREGYFGKLRVIKTEGLYIDAFQAAALEHIDFDSLRANRRGTVPASVRLQKSKTHGCETELQVEKIAGAKHYAPILLSHFFSGVKDPNPLKAYLAYYNVLEYYFEEAPTLLSRTARTELEQLKCVIELLTTEAVMAAQLASLEPDVRVAITSPLVASVGPTIAGVDQAQPSLRNEFARWLYDIRCAVVHSKKTRRGSPASSFEPYTEAAKNVAVGLGMVRWLATLCIEKDHDLTHPSQP
jgi:hypothetical protein